MSQDIVSDVLNQIMNAKKAKKEFIVVNRSSKLLLKVLDIAKQQGHIDYSLEGNNLKIDIKNLNEIKAIKPRYTVPVKKINHYVRRYLPCFIFFNLTLFPFLLKTTVISNPIIPISLLYSSPGTSIYSGIPNEN
jgi:hypothetical protein